MGFATRFKQQMVQKETLSIFDIAVVTGLVVIFTALNAIADSDYFLIVYFVSILLYFNMRYKLRKRELE